MAMTTGNILLPDPLLLEIQRAAQAQHRTADEVASDAVREYLKEQTWRQFVDRNELRSRVKGYREDEVDGLIAEVRRENQQPGC